MAKGTYPSNRAIAASCLSRSTDLHGVGGAADHGCGSLPRPAPLPILDRITHFDVSYWLNARRGRLRGPIDMEEHQVEPLRTRVLLSVKQVAERHPGISERTLRHWIFNARDRRSWTGGKEILIPGNGFAKVIIRKGRKVLIDERALLDWLDGPVKP